MEKISKCIITNEVIVTAALGIDDASLMLCKSAVTNHTCATRRRKSAVVTGSSTGIGFETSLMLARNGFYTYATMRKLEGGGSKQIIDIAKNENLPLQVIQLDVDNDKSVSDAINRIVTENDRIDIVVNNAGYDLAGAIEEISMDEMRTQFETNFFGAIKAMKAVIPIMRKQRSGKIVNITFMGGRIAIPCHSIYHGSKFALEGLSESIQYELEPFGIKIILIEPGAIGFAYELFFGEMYNSEQYLPYKFLMLCQAIEVYYRKILEKVSASRW
jgi:NAD(P)-dependent dehydrogenase (short-subunit alcohol dehydrogenase family)